MSLVTGWEDILSMSLVTGWEDILSISLVLDAPLLSVYSCWQPRLASCQQHRPFFRVPLRSYFSGELQSGQRGLLCKTAYTSARPNLLASCSHSTAPSIFWAVL